MSDPNFHSGLDYWFVFTQTLQDGGEHSNFLKIKTYHFVIDIKLKRCKRQSRGRGIWCVNNSLLEEADKTETEPR